MFDLPPIFAWHVGGHASGGERENECEKEFSLSARRHLPAPLLATPHALLRLLARVALLVRVHHAKPPRRQAVGLICRTRTQA